MSLMRSRTPETAKFKPGDLRSLKHAAEILECDVQTVRKLSNGNLNFTIITLADPESERGDPIYRVYWTEFINWLERRKTLADERKAKIHRL